MNLEGLITLWIVFWLCHVLIHLLIHLEPILEPLKVWAHGDSATVLGIKMDAVRRENAYLN